MLIMLSLRCKSKKSRKCMNKDKYLWTTTVNNKGQIVIPKEAREIFNINNGDSLILFGDIKRGIAIAKYDDYIQFIEQIFNSRDTHK